MKRILLGLFFMVVTALLSINRYAQLPPVEQVWPTVSDPAKYDYYYQSQPWVAVNPFHSNIVYTYVSGKLLKSEDGGQSWHEIGKGLPDRATFPGVDDFYHCLLTFSRFDATGNTLLLGTNRGGVSGVPFLSTDGGETWQTINICEKGPGTLNFRFTDVSVGIFSNKEPSYIFFPGMGQKDGQPVFLGVLDTLTNKLSIAYNPMFPGGTGTSFCYNTGLDIACPAPPNNGSQGCWQKSDDPWYWGGEAHLTVLPDSNDYFETDIHGLPYDCDDPACHVNTKFKMFDPYASDFEDPPNYYKLQCVVDNVYFDTSFYDELCLEDESGNPHPNPLWRFLAPVFYSGEGLTFYAVITQVIEIGHHGVPLTRCYLPSTVLAKCDGPDANGQWIFTVAENGVLPQGNTKSSRQIKRKGDYLFLLGSTNYYYGTLLAYNLINKTWTVSNVAEVKDFELVDLEDGNIGIYYMMNKTELRMSIFNPIAGQFVEDNLVHDFIGIFTGLAEFHVFSNGFVYRDTSEHKNYEILSDEFAVYYSGQQFGTLRSQWSDNDNKWTFSLKNVAYLESGYGNVEFPLCTANFTSMVVKDVGSIEKWGYLSSDAGVWRNKKIDVFDPTNTELLLSFEHISGGYGCTEPCTGEIPATDFGNYSYKVIIDPRSTVQTIIYAACKSGLWKGLESQAEGNPVTWTQVYTQILEGPDAGVKDVLISGDYVFIVTAEGIWRSSDDTNWSLIYDTNDPNLAGGPVTAIAAFKDVLLPHKIAWTVGSSLYDQTVCGALYLYTFGEGDDTLEVLVAEDDLAAHDIPVQKLQCVNEDGCDFIYYLTNAGIMNKVSTRLGCPTIAISPEDLPSVLAGTAYSQTLSATGGSNPYTFKLISGALPTGITLAANGVLSGTPTKIGLYNFAVKVTDINCCTGIQEYSVQIDCPEITFDPPTLLPAVIGLYYEKCITACPGLPYCQCTYSTEGTLPDGITLQEDGYLSGKPTEAGIFIFTIKVVDTCGCGGEKEYSLTVLAECPPITIDPQMPTLPSPNEDTVLLPSGITGDRYDQILTPGGGTPPYNLFVSAGANPWAPFVSKWVRLEQKTGEWHLYGDAIESGIYNFTITATDAIGCQESQPYSLTVAPVTISSKTVELVCENGISYFRLHLLGSNFSAKSLAFFSYIWQADGTKMDYQVIQPVSITDTEVLINIPAEWTYSRAIEAKMVTLTQPVETIHLSPPLFTPFHAEPEGGNMGGGTQVTIHGSNFAEGTTIWFKVGGNWINQNAAFSFPDTMTIAATAPGPTCEGPVDMKIVYPTGCEMVVPSAYIYGYQSTLYNDRLQGAVAGGTKLRFFVCPTCPGRGSSSGCPTTFADGDSTQKTILSSKIYVNCYTSDAQPGSGLETAAAYISSTEMFVKTRINPNTCIAFLASNMNNPDGCPDAVFSINYDSIPEATDPCDYRYHTFNEGLATGGMNQAAAGFAVPVDTDANMALSWTSAAGGDPLLFEGNYISSVSISTPCNKYLLDCDSMAVLTPVSFDLTKSLPLAYVVDVSNHKLVDVDNNPANGVTGLPQGVLPIRGPFGSAILGYKAYIVGNALTMYHVAMPYMKVFDLDTKTPTYLKEIGSANGPRIAVDILVTQKDSRTYAFISEFLFPEYPSGPQDGVQPLRTGTPPPTPPEAYPGLLILDVTDPSNIFEVIEYQITGDDDSGVENFALTLAKNKGATGTDETRPYVYAVVPGANKVLVYNVGSTPMDFVRDNEGNILTYDVGETPTDIAWAHYEFPRGTWNDKVFVTCLNESQVDPCDSVNGLNVQTMTQDDNPYPTEDPDYCSSANIPLPTAIDFRADGEWGYVVKGYGGTRQGGGIIHVFDPAEPDNTETWETTSLAPGTYPTRFDAGDYVDWPYVLSMIEETLTDAPLTCFDKPPHKQALLNQLKAVETLLGANASNTAVISRLDAMEGDVKKWIVHQETKDALVLQLETEKTFVFVQRKVR